jgi:hypothetical protein
VYLFHRLFPELDRFFPSHGLSRKLTLGLVFGAFGLLASASGLALIATDFDSDPLRGPLVFAPEPTPAGEPAVATAAVEAPAAAPAAAVAKGDRIRPCRSGAPEAGVTACDPLPSPRAEALLTVSSPPAAGEAPVARSSEPAEAAPRAAAFVPDGAPGEKSSAPADPLAPVPVAVVPPADASAPLPVAVAPPVAVPPAPPRKAVRARRAAPYQQFSLWPFGGGRRGPRLFW